MRTHPSWIIAILILISLSISLACGVSGKVVPTPAKAIPSQTSPPTQPLAPANSSLTDTPTSTAFPPAKSPTVAPPPPSVTPADTAIVFMPNLFDTESILGLHTTLAVGTRKYIVIRADFPDVKREFSESRLSERMVKFLNGYFNKASYQQLQFEGSMTKIYMLPHPVTYYKISPRNLEVDKDKVLALVNDALNLADADIEFTPDLYVMISLGATNEDYGMIGYSAVPGMLDFKSDSPLTTKSGEVVNNAVVFCENAHLGTYVHDTLHMLGGVIEGQRMTPCLYDHDLQFKYTGGDDWAKILINIGYWDPLSSHMPYDIKLPPSGLSSWTKLRLGWIDPAKIAVVRLGDTATIRLDPLASADLTTLVIKIPISETSYYLVENRQPVESDVNLPSYGVLVLYADDSVLECRHGQSPVKIMDANPAVPYMNDAAFDLGKQEVYTDLQNNLAIVLLQKNGLSYEIKITTPDQVQSP